MVSQLNSHKPTRGKTAEWERELDRLISENVELNDERVGLMRKVNSSKKRGAQSGSRPDVGGMARTTDIGKRAGSANRTLVGFSAQQEHELEVYRKRLLE
jgi:hypothetical protein